MDRMKGGERGAEAIAPRSSHPESGRRGWLTLTDGWPVAAVHAAAAVLTALVGALDWLTGDELSFSIFYLVPVSLAAWRLGRRPGLAWTVVATVTWLAMDAASGAVYSAPAIPYWNAAVRFGFFAIVTLTTAALRRMWQVERTLAGTDYLTGARNSRAFHDLVELERSRTARYNRPFTLAYMDVDGFKAVNDSLGHAAGDEALRLIAATMAENVRSMDAIARLGGDEFGLLFPETGEEAAEFAVRKIQGRLTEVMAGRKLDLTFSFGAVICVGAPASVDKLLQRADMLMYEAKKAGRNGYRAEVLDDNFGLEAILQRG